MTIEKLLNDRAAAVKALDVKKAASFYRQDLRVFDLVDPLQRQGREGVAERLRQWLSNFKEVKDYSFAGLEVSELGDLAICSMFNHVQAVKPDGSNLDMWWRETLGLQRSGGEWSIIHTHSSVPFNPETGKASMGLKP